MTSQNDKYRSHPLASPLNLSNLHDRFVIDLNDTSLKNLLQNDKFRWMDGANVREWTFTGGTPTFTNDIVNNTVTASIPINTYMTQQIEDVLLPFTKYTFVAICSASDSIQFSIEADSPDVIYNLRNISEVDSASVSSTAVTEQTAFLLEFQTNATSVSGGVVVKIEALGAGGGTVLDMTSMFLHKGVVGFNDIQANDAYGATYSDEATHALSADEATHALSANFAVSANTSGDAASLKNKPYYYGLGGANAYYKIAENSIVFTLNGTDYFVPASSTEALLDLSYYDNSNNPSLPFVGYCHSNCVCHSNCDGNWGRN